MASDTNTEEKKLTDKEKEQKIHDLLSAYKKELNDNLANLPVLIKEPETVVKLRARFEDLLEIRHNCSKERNKLNELKRADRKNENLPPDVKAELTKSCNELLAKMDSVQSNEKMYQDYQTWLVNNVKTLMGQLKDNSLALTPPKV